MNKFSSALLATLVVGALPAWAGDGSLRFSGFGTLAATTSSEKNGDFIASFALPNGPGYTRSVDFGGDSRLGGQVDWKISEQFSAVVQAIAEHRYDDTYTPYLNMAHVKWEFHPGYSFRAGRIPYSAYLISDYQKVGFATPWVRPPVEVYQFNPLTFIDGVDFGWHTNFGGLALSGQFVGGTSRVKLAPSSLAQTYGGPNVKDSEWKGDSIGAISLAAFYKHATFRVFHIQMKGTFEDAGFDGAAGPFGGMGPFKALRTLPGAFGGNPALADQFQIKDDKLIYQSAAFNYDPGDWFFMVEQTRKSGDENMFLHFDSGYATLGIRFGNWTPYATAGWKHTTSKTTNANPIVNALVSGLDRGQSSISAGLRWDFRPSFALKAQYDKVTNDKGSYGAFTKTQPAFKTGESYNLATLALDFVF